MPPAEPTLAAMSNPLLRYFLATRPAFLSVTLFACLIGLGTASFDGVTITSAKAAATLMFALMAHAGINVLNDYYDELSGTDRINTERIFPFTGGSRFIQNGVLGARETQFYGMALVCVVILAGLWLTSVSGAGLIGIGAAGLFIGWAYSAPPFKLNSRGWGEIGVAAGFTLIAVGSDFVQRGSFSSSVLPAVIGYALLVTNLLYINQFPDYRADNAAGKHHWVVRLGPERARWGYPVIAAVAYAGLVIAVAGGGLPVLALIALLPAILSIKAGVILLEHATSPQRLEPAIKLTIAAAAAHGLLVAAALFISTRAVS